MYNGNDLLAWGVRPGKHFKAALAAANLAHPDEEKARVDALAQVPNHLPLQPRQFVAVHLDPRNQVEWDNRDAAREHMLELTRTPTVVGAALMPDANPNSGPLGTVAVGGAVASTAIHPGWHSSDVCCSVAATYLEDDRRAAAGAILDAAMRITHFGGGRRERPWSPPTDVMRDLEENPFTRDLLPYARTHFGTQGDGNHFLYVGARRSDGRIAIATHHGSRGLGARLYKLGMAKAIKHTRDVSPDTPAHNAWLDPDSLEGRDYWDALQIVRRWTRESHFAIHSALALAVGADVADHHWNEHNFVFRRGELYLHGKGATPAWPDFADDTDGRLLIPLNMSQPILVARGLDNPTALGFAPHGAGRNYSRKAHRLSLGEHSVEEVVASETEGLDVRFFSGLPDVTELPSAYKDADEVRRQIDRYGLAQVIDQIDPLGCIMAGERPEYPR